MKKRRLLIICAGIVFVVVAVLAASTHWERREKPFQNAARFISALQAFSRDQGARGRRLPPEVSAEELVRGGYLTANDLSSFVGMDLTFNTQTDDSSPQMILVHARAADGQFICLLADGSVQQVSRSRYEQMFQNSGQPQRATDGSQPSRSLTNHPSAAAGSRGPR